MCGMRKIKWKQLNIYTYLSITTWTIMSFFIIYYVMKQYILPLIVENIKFKLFFLSLRISDPTHLTGGWGGGVGLTPTKTTSSYFYNSYNPTY